MTDQERKAMEMALDALEEKFTSGNSIPVERATITAEEYQALRQALAQPEQEPVAWEKNYDIACSLLRQAHDILATTQYPIKRPWVSLTDEEIDEAIESCKTTDTYKYFRAIEAKLKEKNNG